MIESLVNWWAVYLMDEEACFCVGQITKVITPTIVLMSFEPKKAGGECLPPFDQLFDIEQMTGFSNVLLFETREKLDSWISVNGKARPESPGADVIGFIGGRGGRRKPPLKDFRDDD